MESPPKLMPFLRTFFIAWNMAFNFSTGMFFSFSSGVHPEEKEKNIPVEKLKAMFQAMKKVLKKGINFGGDSMSDYRNIEGRPGKFQLHPRTYPETGKKCKKNDRGVIIRKTLGGRSAHF